MGIEGFDRKFDDGGVAGSGDIDAACGEDGAVPVGDLDIQQAGGFAASDEYARAALSFDGCDAVGIEAAVDEADLFSWDSQFGPGNIRSYSIRRSSLA